jgi:pimeloyl-ACP methyl ester carboxylesterase
VLAEGDEMTRIAVRTLVAALAVVGLATGSATFASAERPRGHAQRLLPIVFVHGQSGSAQQFETQAMRFTSNGYPQDLLFAFEYDTSQSTNPLDDLDAFIDEVLDETGAEKVYAIGHSRGTTVWTTYLSPDEGGIDGSSKVAKYVNIDGRSPADLPGGVPTIGIWGEWNTAGSGFNRRGDTDAQIGPDPDDNFHFGDKSHTEVATSAEAFAVMYEFLTGRPPRTTDVVPEPPGRVTVAGRAVLFPENTGYAGSTVQVWRVDPDTGHRIGSRPRATFPIDESGDFGPVRVNGRWHYEFALVRPDEGTHHFYPEPFLRSDHFLRLNTSLPGGPLDAITPDSDGTTNLVVVRMREFWGDQGSASDQLVVDGTNVIVPATSPRAGVNLAVFVHDDGLDGITDLGKGELFPFNLLTFLTAVDVAIPASPDGSGTVSVVEEPRGSGEATLLNVPNWPSSTDAVTLQFRDTDQDVQRFPR